jgi:Bacterial Ig-like domain (group 3)/Putative Ig domain
LRRIRVTPTAVKVARASRIGALLVAIAAAAPGALAATTYTSEPPTLDSVSGGPWNTSQGDPSAGETYASSDLLPLFRFGGAETTLGGFDEPNIAVYPGAGSVPYPSGVAGTPGPLDGYCSSLGANPETGAPVSQPVNSTLPMSPYYFPDVVRNANGTLTGYFDYRPKDAEEAITVATSSSEGETWRTEGEALGENGGYCPTADANDDGQGHPFVMTVKGVTHLYTLQRPAGDNTGVGLLVHEVHPEASDPLEGLPSQQPVGVDPDTFASGAVELDSSEGATIPVSTLGSAGSPEQIVPGPYEDASAATPWKSVFRCTGTTTEPAALTGCKLEGSGTLSIGAGAELLQVIATANPGAGNTYSIPAGPNKTDGEGGLETFKFLNGNETVSPVTTYLMNVNAPNRIYLDGAVVNCAQANSNPTTKLEFCTNTGSSALTVHQGDPITADPIIPEGSAMTSGLGAPDGIVGTLPDYPGAPEGSTVVLYTEKVLSYFIVGTTDGSISSAGKYTAGKITLPASTINFKTSVTTSEPLPSSGSFSIYLGTEVGQPIQKVTCTGVAPATQSGVPAGSENLTGCTGGTGAVAEGNWIGGPNAAISPYSVLAQIGEGTDGKSKGPEKLFGNNEDYSVLRAAYTENGVQFKELGAISGSTSGTGSTDGSYNDLSNPDQTATPSSTSPSDLSPGSPDTVELRYIGSRGTIVTNPDGSYGLFLSGSWSSDGDSDAFNQIFYSSSTNGKEWSVPTVVLSTDYTFSASAEQDEQLKDGFDTPLGISAYYSGRAYGPAVVQNPGGSLTMVFSGYRLPKPIASAGTVLGTNSAHQYTVGEKDPALYRNILTMHLTPSTTPGVATRTSVSSSNGGTGEVGSAVTYTATVAPVSPGSGTPGGTVSFSDESGPIAECSGLALDLGSPDTASCETHLARAGTDTITASYSGDSDYAKSEGTTEESVTQAPAITSADATTFTERSEGSFPVTATGTPAPTVTESGPLPEGVTFDSSTDTLSGTPTQEGVYHVTFTATNGAGSAAEQAFTLSVDAPPAITSSDEATFSEHSPDTFTVTATGTPAPTITSWGKLPAGVSFDDGTLAGTPTETGSFQITFTAENGVGSASTQRFTLVVEGLKITTTSPLPEVDPGSAYSTRLEATGGVAPLKWSKAGGSLPTGLHLSSAGVLSGTVKAKRYAPGTTFQVTVKVADSTKHVHQTATATLELKIV